MTTVELEHRPFVNKEALADRFVARYGQRPACEICDTLIHLKDEEGRIISSVTYSYTIRLSFPIEKEVFDILVYNEVRPFVNEGRLELIEGLPRDVYLDGARIVPQGPVALAEVTLLDRLASRKGG